MAVSKRVLQRHTRTRDVSTMPMELALRHRGPPPPAASPDTEQDRLAHAEQGPADEEETDLAWDRSARPCFAGSSRLHSQDNSADDESEDEDASEWDRRASPCFGGSGVVALTH